MKYRFDIFGILQELTAEELAEADYGAPIIALVQGTYEDGSHYWVYISVLPSRYKTFLKASARKVPMLLQEYGTILRYGRDAGVPASIRKEMKEQYGCDECHMAHVTKEINEARAAFLNERKNQILQGFFVGKRREDQ